MTTWTKERERTIRERLAATGGYYGCGAGDSIERPDATLGRVNTLAREDLTAALAELDRVREELRRERDGCTRDRLAEMEDQNDALKARNRAQVDRIAELEQALRDARPHVAVVQPGIVRLTRSGLELLNRIDDALAGTARVESALQSLGSEHTSPAEWEDHVREATSKLSAERTETVRVSLTDRGRAALRKEAGRCPTCGSTAHLHPAVQQGGEVEICDNEFHLRMTPQSDPEIVEAVRTKRAAKAAGRPDLLESTDDTEKEKP